MKASVLLQGPADSEQTANNQFVRQKAPMLQLPTPTRLLSEVEGARLWLKNDGVSSGIYGGNKGRKLVNWLGVARKAGATELLTVGAAGSHHALATCLFARHVGLRAKAVLIPQRWTAHAANTLRTGLKAGLEVVPARSEAHAAWLLMKLTKKNTLRIGPGGWGTPGTRAYVEAATELQGQVAAGALPRPDAIYVAAGSGSTAAGLLAGFVALDWPTHVIAVAAAPGGLTRPLILSQAARALPGRGWSQLLRLSQQLEIRSEFVGEGYGYPTPEGRAAMEAGERLGLKLDPTYTAKAFACACRDAQRPHPASGGPATYVYWHTLSALTDSSSALVGCDPKSLPGDALPPELSHLFLAGPGNVPY